MTFIINATDKSDLERRRPCDEVHVPLLRILYPDMILHTVQNDSITSEDKTHQQFLWRRPSIWILEQASVHKLFALDWEPPFGNQPGRRFVDDMLQQLEDAHRHSAALKTNTL